MDLASLIESFATGIYAVTRRTSPAQRFIRGVAQPTSDIVINIRASVQPASGADMLRLPELRRVNETRVVFTTTQLHISDAGDGVQADIISIDGLPWEIQHVETWVQAGLEGTGYRCIAQAPTDGT